MIARPSGLFLVHFIGVASSAGAADRLALTNGDAPTGQLRSATATEVVFASDLAGVLTVKRTAVAQLIRTGTGGRSQTVIASALDPLASASYATGASWNGSGNGELAMNRGNSDTATVSINGTATRVTDGEKLAVDDFGDYRVSFDLSLSGPISQHWQWHSTVSDRCLRIPPSGGAVRNDLFVATGLGVTFGHGDVGGYRGADTRVR